MNASFRGTFDQKVDGKGRVSVPSELRDVLASGDPNFPENPLPRVVVLYGPHLKNHVQVYSIDGMTRIQNMIDALPMGSRERKQRQAIILGFSWDGNVEKDGRILMPKYIRDKLGLAKDALFTGRGDHFEVWDKATYERENELAQWMAQLPEDYDPMEGLTPIDEG